MPLFLKGLIIGISIAAPVGPIGILCIRRTLAEGRLAGLATGLGAATADAIYGSIAGFGVTLVSAFLIEQQGWIRLIGGAFLIYLGLRTFLARPAEGGSPLRPGSLLNQYISTFFLTLTNPLTILSFAAIFTGLGLGMATDDYSAAGLLVAGVFTGSALWWLILSGGMSLMRKQVSPVAMRWINRISGSIILGFGIAALVSVATKFV